MSAAAQLGALLTPDEARAIAAELRASKLASNLSCTDLVGHFVDDLLGVGRDLGLSHEVLSSDVDGDLLQRA